MASQVPGEDASVGLHALDQEGVAGNSVRLTVINGKKSIITKAITLVNS